MKGVVVLDEDLAALVGKLALEREPTHPLISTQNIDPRYLMALAWGLREEGIEVYTLDTAGVVRLGEGQRRKRLLEISGLEEIPEALDAFMAEVEALDGGAILFVKIAPSSLTLPALHAHLETVASEIYERKVAVRVLVRGMVDNVWVTHLELTPPKGGHLKRYVEGALEQLHEPLTNRARREVIDALRGLTAPSIHRILERSLGEQRRSTGLLDGLEQARREELSASAGLEVIPRATSKQMGGMKVLRRHLEYDGAIIRRRVEAKKQKVDLPKGILLVGLPGCGKSLAAKVTASELDLPLLRLDVGSLMGKYLGESEERMRRALSSVEASAPCVLWIDELEKALGGSAGGESTGTDTRMLGLLLTWMQENDFGVYVVATANSVEKLPPELLRRGRFDESFFVGLPNEEERTEILKIHLEKRELTPPDDSSRVTGIPTEGFSGAEIEALVKLTHRQRFVLGSEKPLIEELLEQAGKMTPFARQWKDQLEKMERPLKEQGFKNASLEQGEELPPKVLTPALTESIAALLASPGPLVLRPPEGGWTMEMVHEGDLTELLVAQGDLARVSHHHALTIIPMSSTSPHVLSGKAHGSFVLSGQELLSVELRYVEDELYARFDEDMDREFRLIKEVLPPENFEAPMREGMLAPELYGCLSGEFYLDVNGARLTFSKEGTMREVLVEEPHTTERSRYRVRTRGASILLCELDGGEHITWGELFWSDGSPRLVWILPMEGISEVVLDLTSTPTMAYLYNGEKSREVELREALPMNTIEGFADPELSKHWLSETFADLRHGGQHIIITPSHMTPWATNGLMRAWQEAFGGSVRAIDHGHALMISHSLRQQVQPTEDEWLVTLCGSHRVVQAWIWDYAQDMAEKVVSRSFFYNGESRVGLESFWEEYVIDDDSWQLKDILREKTPTIITASPYPIALPSWATDVIDYPSAALAHDARIYNKKGATCLCLSAIPWDMKVSDIHVLSFDTTVPTQKTVETKLSKLGEKVRFDVFLALRGCGEVFRVRRRMVATLDPNGPKDITITVSIDVTNHIVLYVTQGKKRHDLVLEDTTLVEWTTTNE